MEVRYFGDEKKNRKIKKDKAQEYTKRQIIYKYRLSNMLGVIMTHALITENERVSS